MSFKAMTWAVKIKTGSPTKKLILLLLADRANDDGMCFPSIETIAKDCELGATAVKTNIKTLAKAGFLRIEKRRDGGAWLRNLYHLDLNCSDICHDEGVGHEASMVDDRGHLATPPETPSVPGVGREVSTNKSLEPVKEPVNICGEFLKRFNDITGRKFRVLDEKTKRQLRARIKEGFAPAEIYTAIERCFADDYHKQNPKYLTPEFITRSDKLQKYLNAPDQKKQNRRVEAPDV